jgi:hypothetical protein
LAAKSADADFQVVDPLFATKSPKEIGAAPIFTSLNASARKCVKIL